ncbi:MAG: hypothetical protein EOP84_27105 [Verrucomicrobiaceae bacterium]|nr:MAG: hypothetical protein EOP84_27105 [Verrucomicrobiaceae bacterium]
MILNRRHIPWALFTLLASLVAGLFYLANFHPALLPFGFDLPPQLGPVPPLRNTVGGTPLGIIFGALSLLIFLFAAALGIRKKRRLWRIGSPQMWLRAHIWLTILTIPLILFHSGFSFGGPMTTTLMVLYGIVMISGFWGLAMQQFMPRLMTANLSREVVFEQIPHIRGMLVAAAEKLRQEMQNAAKAATEVKAAPAPAGGEGAATTAVAAAPAVDLEKADQSIPIIREFIDEECLRYLKARRGDRHRLGDEKASDDVFRLLKLNVAEKYHPQVDEMQNWCEERRLMDRQTKFHHWLHGWLLVHVPLSFALLVLTIWHGWVAYTYLN